MGEFDKTVNGRIVLEEIEFNRVLYRRVVKSNDRGGKISIPKEFIGEEIYVVIPKGEKKEKL